MASQSTLLGAAGEHHIMSELLRRGFIAALAPQGVPNTDIVVTDIEGSRLCAIQVKARRELGSDGGWHMQAKHETIRADRLFYCFVNFGDAPTATPVVHVVPCAVVADVLAKSHQHWLQQPGKKGQPHKDGKLRRFLPNYARVFGNDGNPFPDGWLNPYKDAWHLLKMHPTSPEAAADGEDES